MRLGKSPATTLSHQSFSLKKKEEEEGPVVLWEFCLHFPGNCLASALCELGCGRRSGWGRWPASEPPSLKSGAGLPGTG